MYHCRFKGSHYNIGVKRGNIFNKNNVVFPLNLDEFQLKHGYESEKELKKYFPEVCDEIKGITDTIKVDYNKFSSWLLAMGCCMYNLETNVPEVRGCTAFSVCYKHHTYYGRNNDLPPFLKNGSKSEIYKLSQEKSFNITTSSFINGEEGINTNGLVVAMTFVGTRLEEIKPGFNAVFIVRYLLEKANNTKEAIKLLLELPIASNCNIILTDKSENMVVVECTPTIKNIRKAIKINSDLKIICTTNCFIFHKMQPYERKAETYKSIERYNNVIKAFENYNGEDIVTYLKNILKGNYGFMCQYESKLNFETIWSSIFDINTLQIYRAEGNPRRCNYKYDSRIRK